MDKLKYELNRNMYLQAENARMSFTQYLETLDPTQSGDILDAFERALKANGIVPLSIAEKGIYASTVEAFYKTGEAGVLFPEYIARQARQAISTDKLLPYLIGTTTPINSVDYRSFYVDDQPNQQKKRRVTEASELPTVKIKGREQLTHLYKYGVAIEASYEALKLMALDMLAIHINRIGMQTAKDQVSDIIDVMINGDGNNNAAPVIKISDLDSTATSDKLTPKGLISYLMEFNIFPCDTIVASKEAYLDMMIGNVSNVSQADILGILLAGSTTGIKIASPQMPEKNLNLIWHEEVTGNKLVGFNKQFAIEKVHLIGSDVSEADQFITRQTKVLTVSSTDGFNKMFKEAVKVLDIAN